MQKLLLNLTILLLLFSSNICAQVVKDLYHAQVPVEEGGNLSSTSSGDDASQEQTFKTALTQVLIKLTGDHKIPNKFGIQSQLKNLSEFVSTSELRTRKTDSQSVIAVQFDSAKVDNLLRQFNLTRWEDKRPDWLAWIILDTGTKQLIVNSEETPTEANLVSEQAMERGLPLLLPLLDVEERVNLPMNDFIRANHTAVTTASQRYTPDVILLGYVTRSTQGWKAKWHLYMDQPITPWSSTQPELSALLTIGINKAVDIISSQFIQLAAATVIAPVPQRSVVDSTPPAMPPPIEIIASPEQVPQPVITQEARPIVQPTIVQPTEVLRSPVPIADPVASTPLPRIQVQLGEGEFELKVVNVPDVKAYIAVYNYLRDLEQVENIFVQRIQPGQVSFRITTQKGSVTALEKVLNDDGLLVPHSVFTDEIVYRLQSPP